MVDGTYAAVARTPLGAKKGTVTLVSDGASCSAAVSLKGNVREGHGTVDGDAFHFEGVASTPVGKLDYVVEGTANGERLDATVKTKRGTMTISGKRA